VVFWVIVPYSVGINPEDGGSKVLRKFVIQQPRHMAQKPRKNTISSFNAVKPHI